VPLGQTRSADRSLGMNNSLAVFDKFNFHGGAFSREPERYIQEFKIILWIHSRKCFTNQHSQF
jgi:hypothetical protein